MLCYWKYTAIKIFWMFHLCISSCFSEIRIQLFLMANTLIFLAFVILVSIYLSGYSKMQLRRPPVGFSLCRNRLEDLDLLDSRDCAS